MTRGEAIKYFRSLRGFYSPIEIPYDACNLAIEALSQPPRPKGRWIKKTWGCGFYRITYYSCSNCEKSNFYGKTEFCPKCGADMRESE